MVPCGYVWVCVHAHVLVFCVSSCVRACIHVYLSSARPGINAYVRAVKQEKNVTAHRDFRFHSAIHQSCFCCRGDAAEAFGPACEANEATTVSQAYSD